MGMQNTWLLKMNWKRLFFILADRGLSVSDMQRGTGLSLGTICRIRKGKPVSTETFGKVAKFLNLSSCELVGDDNE